MRSLNFTALLLAAAMVAGCTGPAPVAPPGMNPDLLAPDPILATDQVRDAKTAIHLGVVRCFPGEAEISFQAELQKDRWFVWADFKGRGLSAEVSKSDGAVTNCQIIEV